MHAFIKTRALRNAKRMQRRQEYFLAGREWRFAKL
jgi:hypothetical protein